MAIERNYTDLLRHRGLAWYNQIDRHEHPVQTRKGTGFQQTSAFSLHRYQSLSQESACGLRCKLPGEDEKDVVMVSSKDARLTFTIAGGVEIPHFEVSLRLSLQGSTPGLHKHITLIMKWTAWGEMLQQTNIVRPDIDGSHTFSDRLERASLDAIELTPWQASLCEGTAGKKGFRVRWACSTPPYQYGLTLATTTMKDFSEMQKASIRQFAELPNCDRFEVFTRVQGEILSRNWNHLVKMPRPTLPPFPLYDCRWHVQERRFETMKILRIPPIDSQHVQSHHRARRSGWSHISKSDDNPAFKQPQEILAFTTHPQLTFINEREYQAIRSIGIFREASAAQRRYVHQFNHLYTFQICPASLIKGETSASSDDFYATLEITIRESDPDVEQDLEHPKVGTLVTVRPSSSMRSTDHVWSWESHTPGLVTASRESGHLTPFAADCRRHFQTTSATDPFNRLTKSPAKPAADPDSKSPDWKGVVAATSLSQLKGFNFPANLLLLKLKKPPSDRREKKIQLMTAMVVFGYDQSSTSAQQKAVQDTMYGNSGRQVPRDNFLKKIILAHDNHLEPFLPTQRTEDSTVEAYLNSLGNALNRMQRSAAARALKVEMKFITLITGPPGTGKTEVSVAIIKYCYKYNIPILIVGGSNKAVDNVASRFSAGQKIPGVYRLYTETIEAGNMPGTEENQGPSTSTPPYDTLRTVFSHLSLSDTSITDEMLDDLANSFRMGGAKLNHLSLERSVLARLKEFARSSQSDDETEHRLLTNLLHWHTRIRQEKTELEISDHKLELKFQQAWAKVQQHILSKARVILCTASTASRETMKEFAPRFLVVEEASQIPEATCLIPVVRYFKSLRKVIMSGDIAQLPPTVISDRENEGSLSEKLSLFERLKLSGLQDICLQEQYRMSPGIAKFVSDEFYEGTLITHKSCHDKEGKEPTGKFISRRFKCNPGDSFFFSISDTKVIRRKGGTSLVNTYYVSFIGHVVRQLVGSGVAYGPRLSVSDILILSYYDEERLVLQALFASMGLEGIRVSSVDAAQGSESSVVILSTTRPGGKYGLGFLTDRRRACVALSRARDCLIVVGNSGMGDMTKVDTHQTHGYQVWSNLVKYHLEKSTFCRIVKDSRLVEEKLQISEKSAQFELAPALY